MEGKPILIIFEGVDKSGKTTLKDKFNKETDFGYVVLDRLTTSSKVYNNLFCRDRIDYYNKFEDSLKRTFNVLVVLCECDTNLVIERLRKANETLPEQLKDIDKVKKNFYIEIERSFDNFMIINTEEDIKECVEKIIKRVKEMEGNDERR